MLSLKGNAYLCLAYSVTVYFLLVFLLVCGDIHTNPGPDSISDPYDTMSSSSTDSLERLSNHLSIIHLKIQSILPKLALLKSEAATYDILVFIKSWLKPEIQNKKLSIDYFQTRLEKTDVTAQAGAL